jgi:hypothetical protein
LFGGHGVKKTVGKFIRTPLAQIYETDQIYTNARVWIDQESKSEELSFYKVIPKWF